MTAVASSVVQSQRASPQFLFAIVLRIRDTVIAASHNFHAFEEEVRTGPESVRWLKSRAPQINTKSRHTPQNCRPA